MVRQVHGVLFDSRKGASYVPIPINGCVSSREQQPWGFEGQHQHFHPGLRLFCLPRVQVMAPRGSWKCGRCVGVALAAVTTCPWLCKELYAIPHVLQFKSAIWWRKHRRNDVEINCLRRSVAVSCQRKCFTGAAVFPSCFQPLLFGWQLAEISLSQSVHLS